MIRVLVVDDHPLFRRGLQRLLADELDMRVQDEAGNGRDALAKMGQQPFDVVLLDINMPGASGLDVLASMRSGHPQVPVIMLSMYPEQQYAIHALRAGASGYVAKDMESEDLVAAIRKVAGRGRYVSSALAEKVLLQLGGEQERRPHERLSPREFQVMMMIVKGQSLTEIASEMSLSVKTVSTYRARVLIKLGAESNAELVRYAVRYRLVD